jgi:uncharacterized protein (DUF58 family)
MDRHQLLQKIATFHLVSRELAEELLAGDFASIFRGEGIEFDEVRHYEAGDDVRAIDWNVSARFGTPYVKMYREERELSVNIILDGSASMFTGGGRPGSSGPRVNRYEQGLLAAALIAFSAERTGQRVGAVFFDEEITQVFRPRKGRPHIMAILSAALQVERGGRGSSLGRALSGTARLLKHRHFQRSSPRSLVVIISDFLSVNWEQELGDLCADHDVIALRITDPLDADMPGAGLAFLRDNETGLRLHAPTGSPAFRAAWTEWHRERSQLWLAICRRWKASALEISTADDVSPALSRFFRARRR